MPCLYGILESLDSGDNYLTPWASQKGDKGKSRLAWGQDSLISKGDKGKKSKTQAHNYKHPHYQSLLLIYTVNMLSSSVSFRRHQQTTKTSVLLPKLSPLPGDGQTHNNLLQLRFYTMLPGYLQAILSTEVAFSSKALLPVFWPHAHTPHYWVPAFTQGTPSKNQSYRWPTRQDGHNIQTS